MGADALRSEPGKSGCLKWTCGCLFAGLVLLSGAGILLWYLLGRWEAGKSAWERLPPATCWALEIHDAKAMLDHGLADPGVLSLLKLASEHIDDRVKQELVLKNTGDADLVQSIVAFADDLSPFYHMLAPNTVLVGGLGVDERDNFAIFLPPVWMRWILPSPAHGDNVIVFGGETKTSFHLATMDGWAIVAEEKSVVETIVAHWDSGGKPLGSRSGRSDAYMLLAVRSHHEAAVKNAAAASEQDAGHFMLGDPFAAAVPTGTAAAVVAPFLRVLITPAAGGWSVHGEMADLGHTGKNTSTAPLSSAAAFASPPPPPASGRDVEASLRFAPDVRDALLRILAEYAPSAPEVEHPNKALGWRWLRHGWLAGTQGDWSILAGKPANDVTGGFPPLPVISIGWTIRDGLSAMKAGDGFTQSLTLWLDSLKAPGGPLLLQQIRGGIRYSVNRGGGTPSGSLVLPPVAVNGARPAWRFNADASPPMGWLATDAAGIPGEKDQENLAVFSLPAPGRFGIVLAGSWGVTDDFLQAAFAVLRERFLPLAVWKLDADEETAARLLDAARQILSAFPKGSAVAVCDTDTRRITFKADIPRGRRIAIGE